MTRRSMIALLASSGVALAGGGVLAASDEERDPVFVESAQVLYLESFPVQVALQVGGAVPTPCHEPGWEIGETPTSVDVTLWSTSDPDALCATVLEPVELSIPLGSYESADLDVTLNGDTVGRIEIDGGNAGSAFVPELIGTGWSFGMCLGYCRADLNIEGSMLVQRGHDRDLEEPLYENHGALTAEGQARVDAAVAALGGMALEETYGCPDCADGGAAYLELRRSSADTRHTMEFGSPPDELAELYVLSVAMMSALEACESTVLVTVGEECTAYQR